MLIEQGIKLDFSDVLIKPKRSLAESRSQVDVTRVFKTVHGYTFSGVPIIASNMATGNFDMLDVFVKYEMFVAIAKHNNHKWLEFLDLAQKSGKKEDSVRFLNYIKYGFYTIGLKEEELEVLLKFSEDVEKFYKKNKVKDYDLGGFEAQEHIKICIDVANGYTQKFANFIKKIRKLFPKNFILAGNVATSEMTQELIINGADCVKLGIGPGGSCLTRLQTGVGVPQIETIIYGADSSHGLNSFICADGGTTCPGDVAKAFVAGADFVMIGNLFAGTDECDGEVITRRYLTDELDENNKQIIIEKKFKLFYGMSSDYAQEKHFGGVKGYRTSEGRVEEKPYIGSVENVIRNILGGLRSACTYVGATKIKQISKCGSFIRVVRQHSRF